MGLLFNGERLIAVKAAIELMEECGVKKEVATRLAFKHGVGIELKPEDFVEQCGDVAPQKCTEGKESGKVKETMELMDLLKTWGMEADEAKCLALYTIYGSDSQWIVQLLCSKSSKSSE